MGRPYTDFAGQKFGKLKAIDSYPGDGHRMWRLACSKGHGRVVPSRDLRVGREFPCEECAPAQGELVAREHSDRVTDLRQKSAAHGGHGRISPPPYLNWPTFLTVLDYLQKNPPPNNRILVEELRVPGVSAGGHSKAISALRFLGLLKEDGTLPDQMVLLLVAPAWTAEWSDLLEAVVRSAYHFVFAEDLNLKEAGLRELERIFYPYRSTKGSVEDCVRFFRMICRAADIPIRMAADEERAYRKRFQGYGHEDAEDISARLPPRTFTVLGAEVTVIEEPIKRPQSPVPIFPDDDIEDDTSASQDPVLLELDREIERASAKAAAQEAPMNAPDPKHRTLKEALAKAASLIMDPKNYDTVVETLFEALPKAPPSAPTLPPLPHFNANWNEDLQAKWFSMYELQFKAQLARESQE